MKKVLILFVACLLSGFAANDREDSILEKVDKNMASKNRIVESSMTIHGKRSSRTLTAKTWSEGVKKSFTEYLSPAAEKGTKMLKLDRKLWIYAPATDRTIQISGSMLRQSVMGSDMSYEDMMDDRTLQQVYSEKLLGEETIDGRKVYHLLLVAKMTDVAYHSQHLWVDAERYAPLRQELYAKSGQLLKKIEFSDVQRIQNRWFPMKMNYKDMLGDSKGTEFVVTKIQFDQDIPAYIFSKAALKQ